jgi:acetyltransferase EpsM
VARLVFLGGGGFAKEVRDVAIVAGHGVVGYVADEPAKSSSLAYLGGVERLSSLDFDGVFIAFGAIDRRSLMRRSSAIANLRAIGVKPISVVSPYARFGSGVALGAGSFVGHGVIVSTDAIIGEYCVLNNTCQIGHDSIVGENVTVAPSAFIAGGVNVGENCLIGPHAAVLQGVGIGRRVIVGVGATVLKNVPEGSTVLPSRSRVIRG